MLKDLVHIKKRLGELKAPDTKGAANFKANQLLRRSKVDSVLSRPPYFSEIVAPELSSREKLFSTTWG